MLRKIPFHFISVDDMRTIWCVPLIFCLSKCLAWETSATSEALSALIDKLIAQTDTKPGNEVPKYKEVETNNSRQKFVNDSNVIYLKIVPNEANNLNLQSNTTNLNVNDSYPENKDEDNDQEERFIERNAQKKLNLTNNKDVLKEILHEIKNKIGEINKPEEETEHKLRTADNVNSNEKDEPLTYYKNIMSGFDLLSSGNPPDVILSKKTIVLNDDANIENIVPEVLTTIKKQIAPIDLNDTKDLLKRIFETKQINDENISPREDIPSRRRYSSNEVTTAASRSNLLRNPSLLGTLDISRKAVPNNQALNLCGNCKLLNLVNVPLNNIINNARLQEVMRRSLIGNVVNTIRPNILYKHLNGIHFK